MFRAQAGSNCQNLIAGRRRYKHLDPGKIRCATFAAVFLIRLRAVITGAFLIWPPLDIPRIPVTQYHVPVMEVKALKNNQ